MPPEDLTEFFRDAVQPANVIKAAADNDVIEAFEAIRSARKFAVVGQAFPITTQLGEGISPSIQVDNFKLVDVIQVFGSNVDIGTSQQGAGLRINRGKTNNVALALKSSGPGWGSGVTFQNTSPTGKSYGIYSSAAGNFEFSDNDRAASLLRIDQAGNIGIGTPFDGTLTRKLTVNGDIEVTGDIILSNADCAEDFDIATLEIVEPGTVMVIDSEGMLRPSDRPYDKRVAGVVSGAGNYKPGLILDKQKSSTNRMPIGLMGKVYCKVDASYGSIEVGDLLTTSPTAGHAMRTDDPMKAFGAVIGKALGSLASGEGLIPILIALQ
jgi:hypothetical protein